MKLLLTILIIFSLNGHSAQKAAYDPKNDKFEIFKFDLEPKYQVNKGDFWGPFCSMLLPGCNQWWHGQRSQGMFYSSWALTGMLVMGTSNFDYESQEEGFDITEDNDFRAYQLGAQIYSAAGGMSAYAAFRSTVKYKQENGFDYQFIKRNETVDELLLAPFEFKFLKRSSTYTPLAVLLGLIALGGDVSTANLSASDAYYTSAYSYNAGTYEEAIFRGWQMPYLKNKGLSNFSSNAIQALIFGAAHGVRVVPLPQILMGYYLGYVTQKNDWSIRESIFIHAWWDILAIGASYAQGTTETAVFSLPLYNARF